MHKTNNVILLIVLLVFIGAIGWFITDQKSLNKHQTQGKNQTWYCPMHPWIKGDKPGVCPICGMALVPWHAHNQETTTGIPGYVSVEIPQEKQQLAAIRTALVGKKT